MIPEQRSAFEIIEPGSSHVVTERVPGPEPDSVLIETICSAVSAGTERLVYTGGIPGNLPLDDSISGMEGSPAYPVRYGYCLVGRIAAVAGPHGWRESETGESGSRSDRAIGDRVVALHPHASVAFARGDVVVRIPEDVDSTAAAYYPNLETVVTLLWDGEPAPGETVAVMGLGTVGRLLLLSLAATHLGTVVGVDPDPQRRSLLQEILVVESPVAGVSLVSSIGEAYELVVNDGGGVHHPQYPGFDLVFELSGNPNALSDAVERVGFTGRIVVASWFGSKTVGLPLGGRYHRARITMRSSQVSSLPPDKTGRFDFNRRSRTVWELARKVPLSSIPVRRVSLWELPEFFSELAGSRVGPEQVIVTYDKRQH